MTNRASCCLIVTVLATQVQAVAVPAPVLSSFMSSPPSSPPSLPGYANGEEYYDIKFGADALQKLDLYTTSAAADGGVPCILFVHGGGWSGGDKNTNKNPPDWILYLRQRGYHVASTNYRLAPNDRHPAQIDDVGRAVIYLKKNSLTYNLDPHKIVAIGTSAGGHLVSLLGTRNRPESKARVAGAINFFGPTILYEEGATPIYNLLGCKMPADPSTECHQRALHASPFTQVAEDNPHFLILHGEDDLAVPVNASKRFQDLLESAGVKSSLILVPEVDHDKDRVACGQTDGLVNTEHIYRWIHATLSPGSPCDSIVCGGGTVYGDTLDLYDSTDAFVSPYCLKVREIGSGCFDDDETLKRKAAQRDVIISGCAEAAVKGFCQKYDKASVLCQCSCASSPPPSSPPSLPA
uniref:BD-FAE-like domain-containing protein n=1 Tax=Calcidiscus leptoporus TaxID=127549 RepID=A0A7S0J689_9EUKA